jgi:hypothetical protein
MKKMTNLSYAEHSKILSKCILSKKESKKIQENVQKIDQNQNIPPLLE